VWPSAYWTPKFWPNRFWERPSAKRGHGKAYGGKPAPWWVEALRRQMVEDWERLQKARAAEIAAREIAARAAWDEAMRAEKALRRAAIEAVLLSEV